MAENAKVADAIQELIDTCRDGEKGYREAIEHTKDPQLKSRFQQISSERGRFANELEPELARAGEGGEKSEGHVVGALHRAWVNVKDALGGGDHSVLAWLEQGDDYAKGKYEDALKVALPQSTMAIAQRQYQSILRDHDEIKALRDARKAA